MGKKEHLFDSIAARYLWRRSDDAKRTSYLLGEIYKKVPKELKNIVINVLEFHVVADRKKRKKVLEWLQK